MKNLSRIEEIASLQDCILIRTFDELVVVDPDDGSIAQDRLKVEYLPPLSVGAEGVFVFGLRSAMLLNPHNGAISMQKDIPHTTHSLVPALTDSLIWLSSESGLIGLRRTDLEVLTQDSSIYANLPCEKHDSATAFCHLDRGGLLRGDTLLQIIRTEHGTLLLTRKLGSTQPAFETFTPHKDLNYTIQGPWLLGCNVATISLYKIDSGIQGIMDQSNASTWDAISGQDLLIYGSPGQIRGYDLHLGKDRWSIPVSQSKRPLLHNDTLWILAHDVLSAHAVDDGTLLHQWKLDAHVADLKGFAGQLLIGYDMDAGLIVYKIPK